MSFLEVSLLYSFCIAINIACLIWAKNRMSWTNILSIGIILGLWISSIWR